MRRNKQFDFSKILPLIYLLLTSVCFGQVTDSKSAENSKAETKPAETRQADSNSAVESDEQGLKIFVSNLNQISITAEAADAPKVFNELSRRLKIPFVASNLVKNSDLSLDIQDFTLEQTLPLLAPHARIDYLSAQTDGKTTDTPVTVYLNAYNETAPKFKKSVAVRSAMVFTIEGDTETPDSPPESEQQLTVNVKNERLTVLARRQNLSFILSKIAAEAGFEFSSNFETDRLIDVDISKKNLVEALLELSPLVRVYWQKDLLTGRTNVFRVELTR